MRRDIVRRYGEKKLYEGGLDIETTVCRGSTSRRRRTSTSRCASSTSGRAGAARWRTSAAPAADEFRRRAAARYGAEPPAEGRLYLGLVECGDADRRRRCASASGSLPAAAEDMTVGGPLQRQGLRQRQAARLDGRRAARGRRRLGARTRTSRSCARFSDWTYDDKSEVQWLPAYDETRGKAPRRPPAVELALEQTPRVQGSIFSYDHGSGYVRGDGGRRRLRSLASSTASSQACRQPGSAYKPIYYSLALDRGYGFASLLNDVPRAEVDPDHRRGLDADQPQQHRRVPGDARVRAHLVEERPVGAAVQADGRPRRRGLGAPARHHHARSSPTRRWRWARRARASTS